jgi:hypothetical protein
VKVGSPGRMLALLALGVAGAGPAAAGDGGSLGYCPLPRRGETPRCLQPAQDAYGEFFEALEAHETPDDDAAARVESALADGAQSPQAYLALSSLAYGYYRLSLRAAAAADTDPQIAARLERWNALLGQAYAAGGDDEAWRAAVREAALDLRRRAPPVRIECRDQGGGTVPCDSTEAVLRGLDAAAGDVGIRGGLERLLRRLFGAEES